MTRNKKKQATAIDAHFSNAGDDFHVKWAMRKALKLLNFDDKGLKCLTVEGTVPKESELVDPTGWHLLGIDLGEFYGGENFKTAKQIVFSQVKHSTARSNIAYTLAKVCEGKGSIIERLASVFKGYGDQFGIAQTVSKLKLKLVSNRPVDTEFLSQLQQWQSTLKEKKIASKSELVKLHPNDGDAIERLYSNSKLKVSEFLGFLGILDFSDCGVGSRLVQKAELIKAIDELGGLQTRNQFNALRSLIIDKTQPETEFFNEIKQADLLIELNDGKNIASLFPTPEKLEALDDEIQRTQLAEVIKAIKTTNNPYVCLHAGAGIGKSTMIKQLGNVVKDDHTCIIYDCYGGGSYLEGSRLRHTHRNACLQLSNDLAVKLGSPFLIGSELMNDELLVRNLETRINTAARIQSAQNPNSLLLLVIDAADNSIDAAKSRSEKSFVPDLLSLNNWESNVRIVVTARSHRTTLLKLPEYQHELIELKPFELTETKFLLEHHFNGLSQKEVSDFHELTNRTPRVQKYALYNRHTFGEVLGFLRPYGKKVGNLIEGELLLAKKRIGSEKNTEILLKRMLCLPRPIPINILSESTNLSLEEVTDFCTDFGFGIVLINQLISFRDEDFETYLRDNHAPEQGDLEAVANVLIKSADLNEYAARHLGLLLFQSDQKEKLKNIILSGSYLDAISDPVLQRETRIDRARFGMKSCTDSDDILNYCKFVIHAAEASKTDKALFEILQRYPEIAMDFSSHTAFEQLFFQDNYSNEKGAINWECAAFFSRNPQTKRNAIEHLNLAKAWSEFRRKLSKEEQSEYRISSFQLAAGAEAILNVKGVTEALDWLGSWKASENQRSNQLKGELLSKFFEKTIPFASDEEILGWYKSLQKVHERLFLLTQVLNNGRSIDVSLEQVGKQLIRQNQPRTISFLRVIRDFAQWLFFKEETSLALEIAKKYCPARPEYRVQFYSSDDGLEWYRLFISYKILIAQLEKRDAINVDDFYPGQLIKESDNDVEKRRSHLNDTKSEIERTLKHILPLFLLKAKIIKCNYCKDSMVSQLKECFDKINNDYSFNRQFENRKIYSFLVGEIVTVLPFIKNKKLFANAIAEVIEINQGSDKFYQLELLTRELVLSTDLQSLALDVISKMCTITKGLDVPAKDKVENHLTCCNLAKRANDDEEAVAYFNLAVQASDEIDLEAYEQIRALAEVSEKLTQNIRYPKIAYEMSRFVELASKKLSGYDHFPWSPASEAIQRIDLPSAIAIWCRWDQTNIEVDGDTVFCYWSRWLLEALTVHQIDYRTIAGMSTHQPFDHEFIDLLRELIPKFMDDHEGLEKYMTWLIHELQTGIRVNRRSKCVQDLISVSKEVKLESFRFYDELLILNKFYSELKPNETTQYQSIFHGDKMQEQDSFLNDSLTRIQPYDSNSLLLAIEKHQEKGGKSHYNTVDNLLVGALTKAEKPVPFLNAFMEIPIRAIGYHNFKNVFVQAFDKWCNRQALANWKQENFHRVLRKALYEHVLDSFMGSSRVYWPTVVGLAQLFELDETFLAKEIKIIFPEIIDKLRTEDVYSCFSLFKHLLDNQEAISLIDWSLERWNESMPKEVAEGDWTDDLKPTSKVQACLAQYIRYNLGHPIKSKRWEAAHLIRELIQNGDTELLRLLFAQRNERTCFPFQNRSSYFYWSAAKVWLFVSLDRIASESVNALLPYAKELHDEVTSVRNAHILVRHLAKSICQKIIHTNTTAFNESEKASIYDAVKSQVKKENANSKIYAPIREELGEEISFPFDSLDTLTHWYAPLGRRFGVSGKEVAGIAERFIYSELSFIGDPHDDKYPKGSYPDTYNRKGNFPRIETLKRHLEYEAMFYVANQLLENTPLYEHDRDDEYDTVDYWVKGHLAALSDMWFVDLKTTTPLETQFQMMDDFVHDKHWKFSIGANDFEQIIGIAQAKRNCWLMVEGDVFIKLNNAFQEIRVSSALCSIKNGHSLLSALQSADRHVDGLPDISAFDEQGFRLSGWYEVERFDQREYMDTFDSKFMSMNPVRLNMSDEFTTWKGDSIGDTTKWENWSDIDENGKYYENSSGSKGYRLSIRSTTLLQFLQYMKMALLIECRIRKESSDLFEVEEQKISSAYYEPYRKLILIYPNGKTLSVSGSHQIS